MRIKSLRKFLILSISLSIILIDGFTIAWSYYSINSNTGKFFDVLLIESAEKLKLFISGDLSDTNLKDIQDELNQCGTNNECELDPVVDDSKGLQTMQSKWTKRFTTRYRTESVFQVWSLKPEILMLHSKHAPSEDFAEFIPGFQTVQYKNYYWRVYTEINTKLNIAIQTAQREDLRNDLAGMIIQEHVVPAAILTPILLLFIFLAIKISSDSLRHIIMAIKHRDPKNLNEISLKNIPFEILPLIDELNRLFELINKSFEREKRFNSDAAHELKTPLAGIKSQTQLALATLADNDFKIVDPVKYNELVIDLNNIVKGVDRSSHVVSQLLLLSRLSPNSPLESVETCYLDKITREVIADSINNAIAKDVEISQDIIINDNSKIRSIKGNKTLLEILARNLIDNAIRYSGLNSKVIVNIIYNLDNITLEVVDFGRGVPAELKDRIFDRFYREPGTDTEGSGLGLSIVRLIARLHNAEIKLSDTLPEVGATFSVIFKL